MRVDTGGRGRRGGSHGGRPAATTAAAGWFARIADGARRAAAHDAACARPGPTRSCSFRRRRIGGARPRPRVSRRRAPPIGGAAGVATEHDDHELSTPWRRSVTASTRTLPRTPTPTASRGLAGAVAPRRTRPGPPAPRRQAAGRTTRRRSAQPAAGGRRRAGAGAPLGARPPPAAAAANRAAHRRARAFDGRPPDDTQTRDGAPERGVGPIWFCHLSRRSPAELRAESALV